MASSVALSGFHISMQKGEYSLIILLLTLYQVDVDWPDTYPEQFPHQMLMEFSSRISLTPAEDEQTERELTHTRVDRNCIADEGQS